MTWVCHVAENVWGRKLLRILRCGYLRNFGAYHPLAAQVDNPWKFSLQKSYFPPIRERFYSMTLNVLLSVKYLLVLACSMLKQIIEGSCVNWADIMASIYALMCSWQFECYKYTLYIGMQYATRFRSNSKISINKNSVHLALACTQNWHVLFRK